ncbi:CNH domain-containing protein [Cladochytrium replicatum]|nr:CNH domain-containing protein [Cladochytrium replicatum]
MPSPLRPKSKSSESNPTFKAMRMCRMGVEVHCAEFLGKTLLIGREDGLYALDTSVSDNRMLPLSGRKYSQLQAIDDMGLLVSQSGKSKVVAVHYASPSRKFEKGQRFEVETNCRKIRGTESSRYFTIAKRGASIYLCICIAQSVTTLKWAAHPLNKFMKIKVVHASEDILTAEVVEHSHDDAKLYVGTGSGFKSFDLQTSETVGSIDFPSISVERLGKPIRAIHMVEAIVFCYQDMGIIATAAPQSDQQTKSVHWRSPLTFASKLGEQFLVCGSEFVVNIVDASTRKVVHVFETKREKVLALRLLGCVENRLFLLVEEEKDGNWSSSVIHIQQDI